MSEGKHIAESPAPKRRDPLALAAQVTPRVELDGIEQLAGSFVTLAQSAAKDVPEGFSVDVKQSVQRDDRVVLSQTSYRLHIPWPDDTKRVIRIEATFAIEYQLQADAELESEAVEAFGKINGIYNSWPYWREYIHQSFARMGLPPLPLPLLTAGSAMRLAGLRVDREDSSEDPQ